MPAQPLTDEQLADAARLKAAFEAHQEKLRKVGLPATQDALADLLGFGQSALNQYLNGKIPLNPAALFKFCRMLVVEPVLISPSIVAAERSNVEKWGPAVMRSGLSVDAIDLAGRLDAIPDEAARHAAYLAALAVIDTPPAPTTKPRRNPRPTAGGNVPNARTQPKKRGA